ncbi:MAG: YqaJ viral recombinase family protein, partial [Undibacterium sp.]
MKILEVEQGTKEWRDARLGMVTGTRFADVMGTTEARAKLIAELIAEEFTEQSKDNRVTAEMERGTAEEPFALRAFEEQTGKKVTKQGMWVSEEMPWLSYSPDGPILEKGVPTEVVEVKNPDSKTVMFYRLANHIPLEKLGLGSWVQPTKTALKEDPMSEATFKPSAKAPFLGIPADYKWQCIAPFLVNPDLKRLHFLAYDARGISSDMQA